VKKKEKFPHEKRVHRYAQDVADGKVVAGWLVRLACQRHLDDLDHGPARGLVWLPAKAEAALLTFEEVFFLAEDTPFHLEDFQAFIVGSLYGWWKDDPDKPGTLIRRFRFFYGEMGKGNGKTPLAAGLGLLHLYFGFDKHPECYSAAAAKDQARICFEDATSIVQSSPELKTKIEVLTGSLTIPGRRAKFLPLSSEDRGQHGKRVSFVALDEIHAHESAKIVRAMVAGTKNCRNALVAMITNSGHDRRSICWNYHQAGLDMLEAAGRGEVRKDDLFAYICTLDPCPRCLALGRKQPDPKCKTCDSWRDDKNWKKANPGLGTICRRAYVAERVELARTMPSELNDALQLNFCMWTESAGGWANMYQWDNECLDATLSIEQFAGRRAALAMDAANRVDVTSLVVVIEREAGSGTLDPDKLEKAAREALAQSVARKQAEGRGDNPDEPEESSDSQPRNLAAAGYVVFDWHFVPQAMVDNSSQENHEAYAQWAEAGELIVTEGQVTDFGAIEDKIRELAALLNIVRFQCDPRELGYFVQRLALWATFEIVEVSQSPAMISQPMKELEALIAAGLIKHCGSPVLRWMISNVVQKTTRTGGPLKYYFPTRPGEAKKIDGAVSLIMGLDGMLRQAEPQGEPGVAMLG
jgi:phage terminase large subunit-like protein